MSNKALGKGLGALFVEPTEVPIKESLQPISNSSASGESSGFSSFYIPLTELSPNPLQPRHSFDEAALEDLANSIQQKGIIQPIIVEKRNEKDYIIIAGERRYRAAQKAGLEKVPVIIRSFTKEEKLEVALIENIQREDLNSIDEARGYKSIMELTSCSQEDVAAKVGKKRSTVANALRLLKLPGDIQQGIIEGKITAGHARAILAIQDPKAQYELFKKIINENISVREAETFSTNPQKKGKAIGSNKFLETKTKDPELAFLEERLINVLGTKVMIDGSTKKGKIIIEYFSLDDLDRVSGLIVKPE